MKCLLCKQGETRPGLTEVTLERDGFRLSVKNVPVLLCPTCNEAYTDEATAICLLAAAEDLTNSGKLTEVCEYATISISEGF